MFKDAQYHELIRKTVVAFGTLFNDIYVYRKNSSGKTIQKMKVPLAYGPKQKFLTRIDQDSARTAETTTTTALTLPRIGFEMTTLSYDPGRKLNRIQKFKIVSHYKILICLFLIMLVLIYLLWQKIVKTHYK